MNTGKPKLRIKPGTLELSKIELAITVNISENLGLDFSHSTGSSGKIFV